MKTPSVSLASQIRKPWLSTALHDKIIQWFFFFNGLVTVFILGGIFWVLIKTALPTFQDVSLREFFTTSVWNPEAYETPTYGILSMVVSTFMVTLGALLLAIPIGIGAAAYLSDVASPRAREIIKPVIEILAAIPSVVIGFLGIVLIGPAIAKIFHVNSGLNAINGSVLLAIMALPTIISISEDALANVPVSYEHASLALGATKWQTVIKVKVPAAMSGIMAACMLGMGRAIGETMTVLMATGCAAAFPHSFLDPVRTLTATIAIELGDCAFDTTHYYALFALGMVLFVITFIINLVSDIVLHRHEKGYR